jgi:phosphate transport system ATP-binding protein
MGETTTMPRTRSKIGTEAVSLHYGAFRALRDVTLEIQDRSITAIIGPSGCGKSTLLRLFNRMNDLIPGVRVEGTVLVDGKNAYAPETDVVALRKRVGMVFQKPNLFPMTVRDNLVVGPRQHGIRNDAELSRIVERSLEQVFLWDELKDQLQQPAQSLSVGQQQRLCIARTLTVEPEVILMDESCSALDPEATLRIEELMRELAKSYTILTVTHNMEQAARVSDMSAFLMMDKDRAGTLVEYAPTAEIFSHPKDKRTEDYITGRFG